MDVAILEREALDLPLSKRASLAHKLLLSLENFSENEHLEVWLNESERRAIEIDQNLTQLTSSDEVSRNARSLLK